MKILLVALFLFPACAANRVTVRYPDRSPGADVHVCAHEGPDKMACISLDHFFEAVQAEQAAMPKHEI